MNARYVVGFDIEDHKILSKGCFVVWDKLENAPSEIIETRFVRLFLFWFWLKGIKVVKEI